MSNALALVALDRAEDRIAADQRLADAQAEARANPQAVGQMLGGEERMLRLLGRDGPREVVQGQRPIWRLTTTVSRWVMLDDWAADDDHVVRIFCTLSTLQPLLPDDTRIRVTRLERTQSITQQSPDEVPWGEIGSITNPVPAITTNVQCIVDGGLPDDEQAEALAIERAQAEAILGPEAVDAPRIFRRIERPILLAAGLYNKNWGDVDRDIAAWADEWGVPLWRIQPYVFDPVEAVDQMVEGPHAGLLALRLRRDPVRAFLHMTLRGDLGMRYGLVKLGPGGRAYRDAVGGGAAPGDEE